MHHKRAIVLFSRTPQINRTNRDEPYAALPWEDLDSLFTAMLGDVAEISCGVDNVDVLLFRDETELSDDFLSRFRGRMEFRNMFEGSFSEQVQQAIDSVFVQGYDQVVVILENNPLIASEMLAKAFDQLGFEDDCVVLGPTTEGKSYLLGMKSNHSSIFDVENGNPMINSNLLMERLCQREMVLFPVTVRYALDSGFNLARLKQDLELGSSMKETMPHRTSEMFKLLEKKYKTKKTTR